LSRPMTKHIEGCDQVHDNFDIKFFFFPSPSTSCHYDRFPTYGMLRKPSKLSNVCAFKSVHLWCGIHFWMCQFFATAARNIVPIRLRPQELRRVFTTYLGKFLPYIHTHTHRHTCTHTQATGQTHSTLLDDIHTSWELWLSTSRTFTR
jgi:hypothetical protein